MEVRLEEQNITFIKQKKLTEMLVLFVVLFTSFLLTNIENVYAANQKIEFDYTGKYQEFTATTGGIYKISLWGAQGGDYDTTLFGGRGGYTSGNIKLNAGEKLYVYVGSQPSSYRYNLTGGWNGGGNTPSGKDKDGSAGGGATDVRTVKTFKETDWNDTASLASRIMVAAGGGGAAYESSASWRSNGGAGGGLNGLIPTDIGYNARSHYGTGGGQTKGGYAISYPSTTVGIGTFGQGGRGISTDGGSGGGSGWYGGGGSGVCSGGGGGSSYISGHEGCIAVTRTGSTIDTTKILTNRSYSWTGYIFTDTQVIDGDGYSWTDQKSTTASTQPSYKDGETTQVGNTGNGHATIEYVRALHTNNNLKKLTATNGNFSTSFDKNVTEYNLIVDREQKEFEISAQTEDDTATVSGTGKYKIKYGETKKVNVSVTSESGVVRVYTINAKRAPLPNGVHSSKLAEFEFSGTSDEVLPELDKPFESEVYNYSIEIEPNTLNVKINTVAYDDEAVVKIEGNDLIINKTGVIKITVSEPNSPDTVYNISYTRGDLPDANYSYDYTGDVQEFIAPSRGKYKIELWGSQGANLGTLAGGAGAYTSGDIVLNRGQKLYVYVGNNSTYAASFNGGALAYSNGSSGGGATDVRLINGAWNDFSSLKSRIMVAAGGGGATTWSYGSVGGAAGGLFAYDVPYYASGSWGYKLNTGATQTEGGSGFYSQSGRNGGSGTFGAGGNGHLSSGYGGGGGSGYYGGAGGGDGGPMTSSGSGGSSYISGHPGCNSISEDSTADSITHTDSNIHYSNKYFTNTKMIDGLGYSWQDSNSSPKYTPATSNGKSSILEDGEYTGMPSHETGEVITGNTGNGYARITPLFLKSKNNYLTNITASSGEFLQEFSPTTYTYDLTLDIDQRDVEISAELADSDATLTGTGKYQVRYGRTTKVELTVTSVSGEIRVYTVNIKRKKLDSHSSKLADLYFNLAKDKVEPILTPDFDPNVLEYSMEVEANMLSIDFDAIAYDDEATIKIDGNKLMFSETGEITITVSEPHCEDTIYRIKYTRSPLPNDTYEFDYSGDVQEFVAPARGKYRFELWGSQGANLGTLAGGAGAYTEGEIILEKNEKLYIYVGNNETHNASFNGGARGTSSGSSGGGATDVRLVDGNFNEFSSLKSRIMVAAAGGGATTWGYGSVGGAAGGLFAYDVPYYASGSWGKTLNTGATQTEGGTGFISSNSGRHGSSGGFGFAGAGHLSSGYGGGGGSGYYGGAGGGDGGPMTSSGSGGSSYISGHPGCNSISAGSSKSSIVHTADNIHYSGKYFTNTKMIDGLGYSWQDANSSPKYTPATSNGKSSTLEDGEYTGMPSHETGEIITGNTGNGYARITPLFEDSHNNYLLSLTSDYGTFDKEFSPLETDYTLNLEKYDSSFTLSGEVADSNASVSGFDRYEVEPGESREINIPVIAPNGDTRIYKVTVKREGIDPSEHSTKLKKLVINNNRYELTPYFVSKVVKYDLELPYSTISLDIDAVAYDSDAVIKIEGNKYLGIAKNAKVTITVSCHGAETTVYEINITREAPVEGDVTDFTCTGNYQEFTAPGTTYYKIEAWGASGGYGRTDWALRNRGGYGAYTKGELYLKKGQKLYVYVGCSGENGGTPTKFVGGAGGFNGGAKGGDDENHDSSPDAGGGGGGATDIRLIKTSKKYEWKEFNSLKSRIMVAAGGGGGNYYDVGGAGGTINGTMGYGRKSLATQTSGYAFGYGMQGGTCSDGSGGAGGGYFGGYSGTGCSTSGGGGSSFVSGCDDCVAISDESTEKNIISSSSNVHSSNYKFDKIEMLSGDETQPSPNGGYQDGNNGDGHLKITASGSRSENNFLREITTDKGTLDPQFETINQTYNIVLNSDEDEITIGAKTEDDTATIAGVGTFDVKSGTTVIPITVTAENGDTRIYTVNVTREASSNALPRNISISGLVTNLCSINDRYCKLDNEFDPNIHTYNMTIPSRIKQLQFTVTKNHKYQIVTGDGVVSLNSGMNQITIEVKSEDGKNISTYVYNIDRDMNGNTTIEKLDVIDPKVDIGFDPDQFEYYFSIPNNYTKLGLNIKLEDEKASYRVIGNDNFEVGLNVVEIEVTAQNGETHSYILNVYREQSGNTFLNEIEVKNGDTKYELVPTYNKVISNYVVNVPNDVTTVSIEATPEHNLTTITGLGVKSLKTGTNNFEIVSTAEDGSVQIYKVSVIRQKSSDALLKKLEVLEGKLDKIFDSNTLDYSVDVSPGVKSLTMDLETNSSDATYKVVGNNDFVVGENKVEIIVTAEDGTINTYTITVNRKASSNNYLNSLTIDKYDIGSEFDKEKQDYSIEVDNNVSRIKVEGEAEDSLSKVTGNGSYSLKTGSNEINITVEAEDKTKRVYTITVYRKPSDNAYLLSLVTSAKNSYTPTFNKNTLVYNLNVLNSEKTITVLAVAEDKSAVVEGNGEYTLDVGKTEIEITVTAENGDQKIYKISVNREKSSNCDLSMLIAKESVLDPSFDKNKTTYELRVLEDITSLTLDISLDDENAKYEVIGNSDFVIGHNTVTIKVTAEDGTVKNYYLDVLRQAKGTTSNKLEALEVSEGVLTPEFDPDVNYYEVEVPYETTKITVSGSLDDKNATSEGFGEYDLAVGKNVLAVKVTSTEDVVRYYQIIVKRSENSEARLANLEVKSATLDKVFSKDVYEYNTIIYSNSTEIIATPIDNKATVEIIGNNDLEIGNNKVIVRVVAADKVTTKDYILNVERKKSDNNNLKSLDIDGASYTPEFSKTTTIYYANVEKGVNTIQVDALAEDPLATVSGTGEVQLLPGKNNVEIVVKSESGNEKIYTIVVTRDASDNNYLSSLTTSVGDLEPEFSKTTNTYNVTVPYDNQSIVINGKVEDSTATVSGLGKYDLSVGDNKIEIVVNAEDGSINIYQINVLREEAVSSKLKDLTIDNYELDQNFLQDLYDYTVRIDYEVNSLNINPVPLDKNATVEIEGNSNLSVGMNTILIKVTDSKNLSTTTYTLNVYKQSYANTFLNYITTSTGTLSPEFKKDILTYTVEVDNDVSSIEVFAAAENESNTVDGTGTYNLVPGNNKVSITVTTSTGIKRVYYVNIVRKKKSNNYLEKLTVEANDELVKLTPTFSKDVTSYKADVSKDVNKVIISATTSDSDAIITGIGTKKISAGENVFDVVVTAEDGSIKTYTITINREASNNNNLTSLIPSASKLSPDFTSDNTVYSLNLDSSVSLLSFKATAEDLNAKITGLDASLVPNGESVRVITVEAEDGSKKKYTISIYKDCIDEARLSSLKVNGYSFNEVFDKGRLNYTLTVPNDKKVLLASEVEATPIDSKATIEKTSSLNLSSLATNMYSITVTARDGFTKKTYTIAIDREKSSNSKLSKLNFNQGTLSENLNDNQTEYTLVVPIGTTKINKDEVEAIASDSDATVNKMDDLVLTGKDDVYKIEVISADKSSTTTYKIKVVYDLSSDTTLKSLVVASEELKPEFSKDVYEYTVDLFDTVESVNISAVPTDDGAKIISGVGEIKLDKEKTTVEVVVEAEDGTLGVYKINFVKSITKNKLLDNIYLEGDCTSEECALTPIFNSETLSYNVEVSSNIKNIIVVASKKHESQKVNYYNDTTGKQSDDGSFKLKAGKNVIRVEVTNSMGEVENYLITINKALSSNSYLESLKITNPEIDLSFDKNTLEYFTTVPSEYDSIKLDYKTEDEGARVIVSGSKNLVDGNNDVYVKVIAEDGSLKTYIIHVTREATYNNYLQSLTVSSGTIYKLTPTFNKTTYDYTVTLPYEVSSIKLDAVSEVSTTTVSGTGEKELKVGINTFTITTTAATGEVASYTVMINREKSTKLHLKKLEVLNGNMIETFDRDKFNYRVSVEEDVTSLKLDIEVLEDGVTYKVIGNNNLVPGSNKVLIILTNEDNSITTSYMLNVEKKKSTNNLLKSLKVSGKELITEEEKDTKQEFDVEVGYQEDVVNIEAIAESLKSKVEGSGKYSLDYGKNVIKINVEAESGDVRVYTINIKRAYDNNLLSITTNRGDLTPAFDKDTLDYYLDVEKEVSDITVLAVASSNLTTVEGCGYYTLDVGENIINIKVSSNDGASKTYTLHINRKKSSNNYLKNLTIEEGVIKEEFSKTRQEYNVEVPDDVEELTIDALAEDPIATVTIEKNKLLKKENKVIIKVEAENKEIREYILNVTVQDKATFSNKLLDLTVSSGTLSPTFDKDISGYTVTVSNSINKISVNGVLESVYATVEGFGEYNLNSGRNEIKVVVTSKDKKTRVYSIVVYRIESSDARLKSVTFKEGTLTPMFDKDTYEYKMRVDQSVSELTEKVVPLYSGTTYEISGNHNLQTGTTTVLITATAEDKKTTKVYKIEVEKEISTNDYLASLETNIGTLTPEFAKTNTGPYVINVANDVASIALTGKKEAQTSTVEGLGLHKLTKGKNTIPITVTSEAGTVRTYTVIVNKDLSSDNTLSFLGISDGKLSPEFSKDRENYTVDVSNEVEEVTVLGIANDKNAKITGNGNYKLQEGSNKIEIVVTAEDGSVKTYTLTFNRKKVASSKLLDIRAKEGLLSPTFDKNTLEYMITVPNEVTSLNLSIVKENNDSTYIVEGNENFIVGVNEVNIIVTDKNNNTTTYKLNVIRQASSNNYLKSLTVENYELNPLFDRETLYYEIEVPNNKTSINISAIAEDSNAKIIGNGEQQLNVGENYVYLTVKSTTGVERVYTIKVTRKLSDNNKLRSLSVNTGELSPTFDKDNNEYQLTVKEGVNEIEISAKAEDENATVSGDGTYSIVGNNTYEITVTAEDGSINVYKIIVEKLASSNNNIENIIPSSGTLNPNYSNSIDNYEVIVDENISTIDFDVILESPSATVKGNKNNYLNYGSNQIKITVEAEDKTERIVHINVIREKNITEIKVDKEQLVMAVDEETEITPTILPSDATNKEIGWKSSDEDVATVDDGKVIAHKIGTAEITVYSIKNPDIKKIINVNVIDLELKSKVYEVRRYEDMNIIIGADENDTLSTFINNLDNNDNLIKIYDIDNNEITDLETVVTTGQKIALEFNGKVYDQAYMAVRGELNSDGKISVTDYNISVEHVLGKTSLEPWKYKFDAANLDEEENISERKINVTDSLRLRSYILGKIDTLNKKK